MTLKSPRADILEAAIKTFYEDDFPLLNRIDSGAEAVTYQGRSAIYGDVCVKCFHSKAIVHGSKREVKSLLKHSFHPNIVRVLGFYEDKISSQKQIGYVMEFMAGGSLHSAIYAGEHYFETDAYNWIIQAARGLQYLHEANIIHRDVKPKNMLLDRQRETLKLSDFGLAKDLDSLTVTNGGGTIPYMAPELISQGGKAFGTASDVYAMGISMLEIFQRQPPYRKQGELALLSKVVAGERPPITSNLDPTVAQLLRKTWITDPSKRCTIMDIVAFANQKLEGWRAPPIPARNRSTGPKAVSAIVEPNPDSRIYNQRATSYPEIKREIRGQKLFVPVAGGTFVEPRPESLAAPMTNVFITPPHDAAQQPLPILCVLKKTRLADEYGFNLRTENDGGVIIAQVDEGGIGHRGGLRPGQRIVGVNATIINRTTDYKVVVALINKFPLAVALLVATEDVVKWYARQKKQFNFNNVRMIQ